VELWLLCDESEEVVTGEAEGGPFIHRHGTEACVEADGIVVPVEHGPLQSSTVALDGDGGEACEEGVSDSLASVAGLDEEVFEVDAWLSEEGRVRVEEEGEPDGLSVPLGDEDFGVGAGSEEGLCEVGFCGDDFMLEPLVVSECTDEVEDEGGVFWSGVANLEHRSGLGSFFTPEASLIFLNTFSSANTASSANLMG
jgi:hypothetical protein